MAAITTGATTIGDLDGLYKEVYADRLENLTPKGLHLQNDIAFAQRAKIGNAYHQPVLLQHEHGFTYAAGASGVVAFELMGNITGVTDDATLQGSYMVLQSALSYAAASRAVKGGKAAFLAASELLVTNMWESSKKRLEIDLLYGQDEIGVVATGGYTADGSDSTITIADAEWAPGLWAGMEGATIQVMDTLATTAREGVTVNAVDIDSKTITISSEVTGCVATDRLFYGGITGTTDSEDGSQRTESTWNSMIGLHNIVANSGTLFGVAGGTYSLWQGNDIDAGTTDLSFHTIQKAVAACVGKGAAGDMCLYIPAVTWANVMTDQAALRRFTGSEGKGGAYEVGAESLKFWTQAGSVEVKPSIYVKEGYSYLIDPKDFMRIGSSDCTFKLPGRENEFFRELTNHAGYELRLWSDQALFTHAPGHCARIKNIVNS